MAVAVDSFMVFEVEQVRKYIRNNSVFCRATHGTRTSKDEATSQHHAQLASRAGTQQILRHALFVILRHRE